MRLLNQSEIASATLPPAIVEYADTDVPPSSHDYTADVSIPKPGKMPVIEPVAFGGMWMKYDSVTKRTPWVVFPAAKIL